MKVKIENTGDTHVRVIVDHDTVSDTVLEPGATDEIESALEGVIELRELNEGGEDAHQDDAAQAQNQQYAEAADQPGRAERV